MIRALLALAIVLTAGACDDESPDGPGRETTAQAPLCQWKTPCPKPEPLPDGGAVDGGTLPR